MKKIILLITQAQEANQALELYNNLLKRFHVELIVEKDTLINIPQQAHIKLFDEKKYHKDVVSKHITIVNKADLLIVYPVHQNFIAKIVHGFSDDLPSLIFSAANCHKIICPDQKTLIEDSNHNRNYDILRQDGIDIFWPNFDEENSKKYVQQIIDYVEEFMEINESFQQKLQNKNILINLGRTRTYIDDVRYITNNSSGKMGKALIEIFKKANANVQVISGDVDIKINHPVIKVKSNQEMLQKMQQIFFNQDIVICVAALNDFRVANQYQGKINKKNAKKLTIELIDDVDVLHELGKIKTRQILIGFSAQDNFDSSIAQSKLQRKNLDFIILNHASAFESDYNAIKIIDQSKIINLQSDSKLNIAKQIVRHLITQIT